MRVATRTLLEMATVMMKTTTLDAILTLVTVVDPMLIQITAQNVNASMMKDQMEEVDVPFQITLAMDSVMMEITIKNATMMVMTAVDPMSIQITVMNVYVLNEKPFE